jgi:hypothetical protein
VVIPVLLDDCLMPGEQDVPRSLHPLLRRQKLDLRPGRLDADFEALIARLEEISSTPIADEQPPPPPPPRLPGDPPTPRPDREHYAEVARAMVEDGSVIPFLGPGANSSDRDEPWEEADCGYFPDAGELAAYLAGKFGITRESIDLAQVSQYVSVSRTPGDLYKVLRRAFGARCPPGSVHRCLANFPKAVHDLGLPERYQLIVTTNYDDSLERAFEDAEEPYDLAVYVAKGEERGKFIHVPFDGEPRPVGLANKYNDFPIERWGELRRTVIVKIHGAVDGPRTPYAWQDNYVITEDDYIDYLSRRPVSDVVPGQILAKLRDDRFLFLGYTMRDWNLRVFLQRMFGQHLPNNSWAIQETPERLESRFWRHIGVDPFALPLKQYVAELEHAVAELSKTPV